MAKKHVGKNKVFCAMYAAQRHDKNKALTKLRVFKRLRSRLPDGNKNVAHLWGQLQALPPGMRATIGWKGEAL